jgi:hypothetical protein
MTEFSFLPLASNQLLLFCVAHIVGTRDKHKLKLPLRV